MPWRFCKRWVFFININVRDIKCRASICSLQKFRDSQRLAWRQKMFCAPATHFISFQNHRTIDQISSSNYRERFKLLYPCTRPQHSPRSFHTYTTTVETHREISWSLHFHYTTTWTRHPNWHPTTRWHLNSRHVEWVPTLCDGVTVDIFLEQCHMAMALHILRFQLSISGPSY